MRHLYWILPALNTAGAVLDRLLAGDPLSPSALAVPPIIGLAVAFVGNAWARHTRRGLERELREKSRALEESRTFLERLVDACPAGIVVTGASGRIDFVNRAASDILGEPESRLRGERIWRAYPGGLRKAREHLEAVLRGGGIAGYRTAFRARDGREVPVNLSASLIEVSDDGAPKILAVFQDLSAQVRAEETAREAERLRVLGECVAGVAHELNNPLTGVIGYLQLALRGQAPNDMRATLRKVSHEAERMAHTIRTLLGFVRKREPERVPTDLNEIVGQVCDFQGFQLSVRGIELETRLADLPQVVADPNQIRQVVLNLVRNAESAIEESGRGCRIRITTRLRPEGFLLVVEDDGPGIPVGIRDRIFDSFFTTKPPGRGTGLGLAICREIVESHGGGIELARSRWGGARFEISLPLPVSTPVWSEETDPIERARGCRVLLVDDDEAVREYIASVLLEEGHAVREVANAEEAIRVAGEEPVDVVLVDWNMPGTPGDECARRLVEADPSLARRLILMSGGPVEDWTGPFLAKPMSPEQVLSAVASVLGERVGTAG